MDTTVASMRTVLATPPRDGDARQKGSIPRRPWSVAVRHSRDSRRGTSGSRRIKRRLRVRPARQLSHNQQLEGLLVEGGAGRPVLAFVGPPRLEVC